MRALKHILFILSFFLISNLFSQPWAKLPHNLYPNYTNPLFEYNLGVVDTAGFNIIYFYDKTIPRPTSDTFLIVYHNRVCLLTNPGFSGITGPTGPTGSSGGPTGPTGPTGNDGINGIDGVTGPTGNNGTAGITGATGPTGNDGINGVTGATGVTGHTGPIGIGYWDLYTDMSIDMRTLVVGNTFTITGLTPTVGLTAFQNGDYVKVIDQTSGQIPPFSHYFNGTVTQFFGGSMTVMVGEINSNGTISSGWNIGETGYKGTPGVTGPTGNNGTAGATGATGPTGNNGTAGITGATGPTGNNGTAGITGATGNNGTNGTNGVTGATGATGPSGGPAGPTGATGPAGAYTWLDTRTLSSSITEVDFNFSSYTSTYTNYVVVMSNISSTSSVSNNTLLMQVGTSGNVWATGSVYQYITQGAFVNNSKATGFGVITASGILNTQISCMPIDYYINGMTFISGVSSGGIINLLSPLIANNNASNITGLFSSAYLNTTSTTTSTTLAGTYFGLTAGYGSIRFYLLSGNFYNGIIKLYGIN